MSLLGNLVGALRRQWRQKLQGDHGQFGGHVRGVVHVGANTGQERLIYDKEGLNVLWIEPIPSVFDTLVANIRALPKQRAVCALVTDRDGVETPFHIANNDGKSSSILDLKHHADIYPDIKFKSTITLISTTLAALFASPDVLALQKRWFQQPIGARGIVLGLTPSPEVLAAWKHPSDEAVE